jgi:GNAT superfamily N-acetyltransferase
MTISELKAEELDAALRLVWNVFLQYEAPEYTAEGTQEFRKSIDDPQYLAKLRAYGAFQKERLVGVIATRRGGGHIALFFVDGTYHRHGIGRALFERACEDNPGNTMTVNASPYAVPVYHRLGFTDTDTEQVTNGLRYTPMVCKMKQH